MQIGLNYVFLNKDILFINLHIINSKSNNILFTFTIKIIKTMYKVWLYKRKQKIKYNK